jgi:hypothetical protein
VTDHFDGVRLLLWSTPDGKPCYLVGDGTGYVARFADDIESIQLDMGAELWVTRPRCLMTPRHRQRNFVSWQRG